MNLVEVVFRATESIDSLLNDNYKIGNTVDRYMSKKEGEYGVYKLPSSLPIDLNSFRFLAGGDSEE